MNIILAIKREALSSKLELNEIDFIYKKLLNSFFKLESTVVGLNPQMDLSSKQEMKLNNALLLIQDDCPLQYVIGAIALTCAVGLDKDVLIPRPETEELVNWILKSCKNGQNIFDLCTGSGCIALGLKKHNPTLNITGLDISKKAILIAVKNAKKLNLDINWKFRGFKKN